MLPVFIWNIQREIISTGPFSLGDYTFRPLALRWYSLLFALGFMAGYFIVREMFVKEGKGDRLMDTGLFHVVIGTIVGARLGHCLFYEPAEYLSDPIRILKVWEGGLASHGGYLGVMIALAIFCYKNREIPFLWLTDRVAPPAMMAGGLIRIGNFFNSEILGHPTDPTQVPWAVVFEQVDNIPRHPTQLYEAAGYFLVAAILYAIYRFTDRKVLPGRLFGLVMLLGYGVRVAIEFIKENQVAFEQGMTLNMGQMLSIPFMLIGLALTLGVQKHIAWMQPLMYPPAAKPASSNNPAKPRSSLRQQRKGK